MNHLTTLDENKVVDDNSELEYVNLDFVPPVRKPHVFILCHRDCDGWGAGAIAYNCLADSDHTLVVKGVQYGEPLPEMDLQAVDQVYILDFSYDRETLLDIHSKVAKLVVLDHHLSAQEALEGLPFAHFDMTKSGILLAWEYFVPEYPAPEQVELLNAYDLWNKKHPKYTWDEIATFQMACAAQEGSLGFWSALMNGYVIDPKLRELGQDLYQKFQASVRHVLEAPTTEYVTIDDQPGVCFFSENEISLMSDALYSQTENSVTWTACFFQRKGHWVVSFRSPDPTKFVVLPWAKKLGGGGHLSAAGAKLFAVEEIDAVDLVPRLIRLLTQ